jgi:hypothetical protein
MSDDDIDPKKVHFRYEPPYPPMSAERIARLEQTITEEILRPLIRSRQEE